MQSRDISIITHIQKYCIEIKNELKEIKNDKELFVNSTVYKNSLALCVLQIGELSGLLSEDFKNSNKIIDWKNIKGMRNIVAHKYGSFDFEILWETVTEDVPVLLAFCSNIITECETGSKD